MIGFIAVKIHPLPRKQALQPAKDRIQRLVRTLYQNIRFYLEIFRHVDGNYNLSLELKLRGRSQMEDQIIETAIVKQNCGIVGSPHFYLLLISKVCLYIAFNPNPNQLLPQPRKILRLTDDERNMCIGHLWMEYLLARHFCNLNTLALDLYPSLWRTAFVK